MSQFENVTIIKKANIYFDGKVTSRTIQFSTGETKTLGIMSPGECTFNTDKKELMEILTGNVEVLLPDNTEWQHIKDGENFEVKAGATFQIKVNCVTDYCCSYIN